MPNISWSMTAQVPGGPKLSLSKTFEVGAYDAIEAVLSDNTPKTLDVQPSTSSDQIKFLIISSNLYNESITYTVSDTDGVSDKKLDAPQVLLGEGAVSLLGAVPKQIEFTNGSGQEVRISILVGRDPVVTSTP